MINAEELLDMIEEDNVIDRTNLEGAILQCPRLQSKYLRLHYQYKKSLIAAETYLNQLVIEKQEYYMGKAEASVYRDKPFNINVKSQAELGRYLDSDSDICEYRQKMENVELCLEYVREMLDQTKYRPNHLNTVLEVRRFESGS